MRGSKAKERVYFEGHESPIHGAPNKCASGKQSFSFLFVIGHTKFLSVLTDALHMENGTLLKI